MREASHQRDAGHGDCVSYSRKVFIPLTRLCRNVCHYCTFARTPGAAETPYLSPEQVLEIARAGQEAGCTEALFTLGDKPELRYRSARDALKRLGAASTVDYLARMCDLVLRETSLLPHVNGGVMRREEIEALRRVSVSQGLMLETSAARLGMRGMVHHGCPDKVPAARLECIRIAGELQVPFTTGILIGINETREERIDSLLALERLHAEHGHIQEIIVQNFRAKPGTPCAHSPEPTLDELKWTIAAARLIFGPAMNIQAPPNLSGNDFAELIDAGINDWGGVSPVTADHVNPEAPWPQIEVLEAATANAGKVLVPRLPVYPAFCADPARHLDAGLTAKVLRAIDAEGWARGSEWAPGASASWTSPLRSVIRSSQTPLSRVLDRASAGEELAESEIVALFAARGSAFDEVCAAADALRARVNGDTVRYVVNRNITYTNVCAYRCAFCAFSKGRGHADLRGTPYDLDAPEIERRAHEAWKRGATEVCMQGGIHPDYTGETYLALVRLVKQAVPGMHVHAFSPLEIAHGAQTLGVTVPLFLERLAKAGLGTLPGTAAEVLHDDVRKVLCPGKLSTQEWLEVVRAAHEVGLPTTATIMFGHIDAPAHWASHLLHIRRLQAATGGFTEFVPLPFVHMEAPIYHRGSARRGPTAREAVLMHAVARLVLHPVLTNIQVSWVKMGTQGAATCLNAGANDLGGTLMNESISRAAGTVHGQELPPGAMDELIGSVGRRAAQRTTLYQAAPEEQVLASYRAAPLMPTIQPAAGRYAGLPETGAHALQLASACCEDRA